MTRKYWNIKEVTNKAKGLAQRFNLSPLTAQILLNRDIQESEFDSFLNPAITALNPPSLLPDMDRATERIRKAVKNNEKIFIVGDYDVDGITSLAIFHEFVKDYPGTFSFYIPHRVNEGYGLNKEAVEKAYQEGVNLIVCFDCGTNSLEEVSLAKSYGMDMIVIDHHHPKENTNKPFAFINPKRRDSAYPFPDLSSAALSFKLLQALKNSSCPGVLDLVALSLVCDVVPLKGENRILLKEGLKFLKATERPAIKALCEVSSIRQQNIDVYHVGYILGPRINASGRVATAHDALDIFLHEDTKKISEIASKLHEYNQLRKNIEVDILKEAQARVETECLNDHAIVVHSEDWHPGVLGIIAARLVERYYRPSFVISFEENVGRGSGRSIHSVNIIEALDKCSEYLYAYGGHKRAAGIQVFKEELELFKEKINSVVQQNTRPEDLIPVLDIDAKIDLSDITETLIDEIEKLKPFGEENPQPLFLTINVFKRSTLRKISSGYSVWLTDNIHTLEALIYDDDITQIINYGDTFDIVYAIEKNSYYNTARLFIKDCRLSS